MTAKVPERGLYSMVKTFSSSKGSTRGKDDGVEFKVFVVKSAAALSTLTAKDMVKVMDDHIAFTKEKTSFDRLLGLLPQGARVFFCIGNGPSNSLGSDSSYFDFTLARGPVPALTPSGTGLANNGGFQNGGLPVLGGGIATSTVVSWRGTADPDGFNVIVIGASSDPRLQDGSYFITTNTVDTNAQGGVLWRMKYTSAIFVWTNQETNDVDEHVFASHGAGHASNSEVISFKSKLTTQQGSSDRTQLGFTASNGWTSPVTIQFTFHRLA